MVNKFMERGTNKENMWKHGNIWQLWKGTREQGNMEPLGRPSVMPNMVCHDFIAGFGQRKFSVQ